MTLAWPARRGKETTTPRAAHDPASRGTRAPPPPRRAHLPDGGRLRPADLQEVVALLQLEVGEDQGDGVPGLGQDGPRAVGVVVVLRREVGAGDAAAGAPQGPPAGALGCGDRGNGVSHMRALTESRPRTGADSAPRRAGSPSDSGAGRTG